MLDSTIDSSVGSNDRDVVVLWLSDHLTRQQQAESDTTVLIDSKAGFRVIRPVL
jgi:hypothetical protein